MSDTEFLIVRYESELAAQLADLLSIRQDLQRTDAICQRLFNLLSAPDSDSELVDVLWTAALVRYARCFTTGKRRVLDPMMISHLSGDPVGTHAYYKNQRDTLVAHSVNPFEESSVGLVLSPPGSPKRQIVGSADFYGRFITSDKQGVKQLGALAKEFLALVEKDISDCTQRLLSEANSRPIDELYSLEPLVFTAPEAKAAAKSRK